MTLKFWKIKSATNASALTDKVKNILREQNWTLYEDGHNQLYAILQTETSVEKETIEKIVAPAIVY